MKTAKVEPMVTRSTRSTNPKLEELPQTKPANRQSSPSRSTKKKSSPVSKSPSRRSPSRRSPSRRSPSRKSPSRKSPSREYTQKKSSTRISPKLEKKFETDLFTGRRELRISLSNDLENFKNNILPKSSPVKNTNGVNMANNIRVSLRERRNLQTYTEPILTQRRVQAKERESSVEGTVQSSERSVERSEIEDFSEEDIPPPYLETRKLFTPNVETRETTLGIGTKIMAMFLLFTPALFIAANIICSKQPCTFSKFPSLKSYFKLESWINLRSATVVLIFFLTNALSSLLPYFGKKTVLPDGKHTFTANSLFTLLCFVPMLFVINFFYLPIFNIIYEDYVQLTVSSAVFGIVLALVLHIKGGKILRSMQNPNGNSGNFIYDLCIGREINPILFNVFHVKVILMRLAVIGMILVNLTWIIKSLNIENIPPLTIDSLLNIETYKKFWEDITLQPTLLVFGLMQIIFALDCLIFEHAQTTTLEFMHEGVGYIMCVGYFLYPFIPTLITKRLVEQNISLPNWTLAVAFVLFLIGYYIYRVSNSQKHIFRQNRLDPRVQHLDNIPTFHGKHLLVGGWWGFVRHPNYLGDLIMQAAWAIGTYNAIPIYFIIFTYVYLIHRVKRDAIRCNEQYGVAWKRYCQKVPYSLLPKIY